MRYVFVLSFELTDVQPPSGKAACKNPIGHGFEPWCLPFCIFHTFVIFYLFLAALGRSFLGLLVFSNILPPVCLQHPWPMYFYYSFYFNFYFIKYIFLNIKNHKKYKNAKFIFLVHFILFFLIKNIFLF